MVLSNIGSSIFNLNISVQNTRTEQFPTLRLGIWFKEILGFQKSVSLHQDIDDYPFVGHFFLKSKI